MNVRKPSDENLPAREFPILESFFMHPGRTASLLKDAVNEGIIDPKALEAALNPFVEKARKGNERKNQDLRDQLEIQTDVLKTHLFTKLVNFAGGIKELKQILEPFCIANNLNLEPVSGGALNIDLKNSINPDWISKDGVFALRITHNAITIYTKLRGVWAPFNQ